MIYRDTKTGVLIETTAEISGGNWQEVKPATPETPEKAEKKTANRRSKKNE